MTADDTAASLQAFGAGPRRWIDSVDGDIEDIASHRWFTIGMRGSHNPGG